MTTEDKIKLCKGCKNLVKHYKMGAERMEIHRQVCMSSPSHLFRFMEEVASCQLWDDFKKTILEQQNGL